MRYGIMGSPFGTSGFSAPPLGLGCFKSLKLPLAAAASAGPDGFNFTAVGLTAEAEAVERGKWAAALEFFAATGQMDLAYDGWFRQNDFDTIFKHVNFSMPDYYSMDIESFPEWETWAEVGYKSKNFVRERVC